MSLPHALLTSIVERPSTGADLARRFDRSIGHFWQATHQQIYRELARLEEAGWVRSIPVEDGRGRQRSYEVLAPGKAELRRWVADQDSEPKAVRDELMVRIRAEAALGPSGLDKEIRRRIAREEEKLTLYRDIETQTFSAGTETRAARLQHLVLDAGIRTVSLRIQIAKEALEILSMADSPRPDKPRR